MGLGCDGTFTCVYEDETDVEFNIKYDEHDFDADSEPVVDIHHQSDLLEKKGAWEVIHDKLHFVSRKGELITIEADSCNAPWKGNKVLFRNQDPKAFFTDEMKKYREEQCLERPESWEYTSFDPEEED